jgi:hypothetical protein
LTFTRTRSSWRSRKAACEARCGIRITNTPGALMRLPGKLGRVRPKPVCDNMVDGSVLREVESFWTVEMECLGWMGRS